jgi:Fe-S-cluster containining protein
MFAIGWWGGNADQNAAVQVDDTLTRFATIFYKNFRQQKMAGEEKIFLTHTQAINAIRIDFHQYGSQFDLFQELCPIISDNKMIVSKDGSNNCVLITRGRKSKVRRMKTHDIGDYLFNILSEKSYPLSVIAVICSKVFLTEARVGTDTSSDTDGIWIENEMAHFKCRHCGNCCQNLKYHNACSEKDYRKWKALDRKDILEKVIIVKSNSQTPQYKIWREPGTSRFYPKCPWLQPSGFNDRYECRIHDVKPEYCRQYPLTRKHAMMTGCKGIFKKQI